MQKTAVSLRIPLAGKKVACIPHQDVFAGSPDENAPHDKLVKFSST